MSTQHPGPSAGPGTAGDRRPGPCSGLEPAAVAAHGPLHGHSHGPIHGDGHGLVHGDGHGLVLAVPRARAPLAALAGLGLLALAGAWLAAAPFLLGAHGPGDQRRGAAWTAATRVDVGAGAAVLAVAVAALLGYLASSVTWSARYRRVE